MTGADHAVSTVFENVRLAHCGEDPGDRPAPGQFAAVLFEEGLISGVSPMHSLPRAFGAAERKIDGKGRWLLPGWIDIQVNDIEWLAQGLKSEEAHAERIREVVQYQALRGVTGLILATLAAPHEEVLSYLGGMKRVLDEARPGLEQAFLGGLVEGTFMNPVFHGAHNPDYVVSPEIELLDRLVDTGAARLINIAPEMSENALDVIAHAAKRKVIVGVGHAKPSAERVRRAIDHGLSYVIHLGNGPTGSSLKSFGGGGLFEESLYNDRLTVTLIADGYHLDRRLLRDILVRKGIQRAIAVSDAGFATGNPEGEFEVFGVRGRVSDNGEYLQVVPNQGAPPVNPLSSDVAPLFGSASDMSRIFKNLVNTFTVDELGIYQALHEAIPLPEAVSMACRLISTNPALLLGERKRGQLSERYRADAVLVDIMGHGGRYRFRIDGCWVGGEEVGSGAG